MINIFIPVNHFQSFDSIWCSVVDEVIAMISTIKGFVPDFKSLFYWSMPDPEIIGIHFLVD